MSESQCSLYNVFKRRCLLKQGIRRKEVENTPINKRKMSKIYDKSKPHFSSSSEDIEIPEETRHKVNFRSRRALKRRKIFISSESESESESEYEYESESESETNTTKCISNSQENGSRKFVWSKKNLDPIIHNFDKNISGIKANINKQSSILEIFQLFISTDLIDYIVKRTNHHYLTTDLERKRQGFRKIWKNTSINEIYRFLAATMLMSRVRKLSVDEYWSTNKLIQTESFKEIIRRDRYCLLLQMLYLHDNNRTINNPLMKMRVIINKIRDSFAQSFYPFQNLCIDESLLLFKEKCVTKLNIPSNSNKFGIKCVVLCDCETGYIQDFMVYSKSHKYSMTKNEKFNEIGKSGNVVMTLLQPYLQKGHTLVADDWYTSPSFFLLLHKNKTNAFGTVRKYKRGMPTMTNKLQKGEFMFRSTDRLLALKWFDKREVFMLSTYHSAEMVKTAKHNLTGKSVMKPNIIRDYNCMLGVIDKTDMTLNTISSIRRTMKWYKKFFFHMLDLSIYNAYVLYQNVTNQNLTFSKFHLNLIEELLEKFPKDRSFRSGGKKSSENNPFRLIARHFPTKYINLTAVRQNARRKCVVCTKHKKRTETQYECEDCNVGLCVIPCFQIYHTQKDY